MVGERGRCLINNTVYIYPLPPSNLRPGTPSPGTFLIYANLS